MEVYKLTFVRFCIAHFSQTTVYPISVQEIVNVIVSHTQKSQILEQKWKLSHILFYTLYFFNVRSTSHKHGSSAGAAM